MVRASSNPDDNRIMMAPGHEVGFGFFTNVTIDQHVDARHRENDLAPVMKANPDAAGTGSGSEHFDYGAWGCDDCERSEAGCGVGRQGSRWQGLLLFEYRRHAEYGDAGRDEGAASGGIERRWRLATGRRSGESGRSRHECPRHEPAYTT